MSNYATPDAAEFSLATLIASLEGAERTADAGRSALSDTQQVWIEYRDELRAELARRWESAEEEAYAENEQRATAYATLTDDNLAAAAYWLVEHAERARYKGYSRAAGIGRAALRDVRAEQAKRDTARTQAVRGVTYKFRTAGRPLDAVTTVGKRTDVQTARTWTQAHMLAAKFEGDDRVSDVQVVHEGLVRVIWR